MPLIMHSLPRLRFALETAKKGLCPFLAKGLQSAARTICTPLAYKSHTCSLIGIFCQVHAPTENDQNPFAACGRQTLRGFFDTLSPCLRESRKQGALGDKLLFSGALGRALRTAQSFRGSEVTGVRIPRMKGTAER